jgi:2-polyprenyl-6-methoxyphenol hydroxylase-like FAD-dependent oxidoreductase
VSVVGRVLVVGGGIGGLCTAIALRRADPQIAVDVVEVNPEWTVYGVGIIQPGNALRALDSLGLAEQVLADGFGMEGSRFHLADGTILADLPFQRVASPDYPAMNGITRTRLHEILTAAVGESGAEVRLGVTVDVLDDGPDAVTATYSDGTTGTYDLVVGADGIHSKVRALVFPDAPGPAPTGQVCWRCNVPRPEEVDGLWMFTGRDGKAGIVPLAPDLAYILLIEDPPPGGERVADEDLPRVMRERLAEFGGVIGRMRDEHVTDDAEVVLRSVQAVFVEPPWHHGRVVLVGDAAHATSPHVGQGAAMAIEDAVVLAEELTAAGDDLDAALTRHTARRVERCRFICEASAQIGAWELARDHHADFAGLTMRSTLLTAEPI